MIIKQILKALPLRAAAAVGVAFLSIFGLGACGGAASAEPTNLDGTWVYSAGNSAIVAEVKQDTIQINFKNDADLSLYWAGTFKSTAKDGDKINSAANVEQLKASLTGSQDSSKEFIFSDGKISFKMSMMGTTKTIELEKNSSSTN